MRGLDKNKDTVIDPEEFAGRFGVIFTGYVEKEAEKNQSRLSDADSAMLAVSITSRPCKAMLFKENTSTKI